MKHGSLFSGIGGFDLAADWMGWENVFHCEIAEFPRKILNHYWPNAECHEDIKKTDFTKYRGTVDIISGGFPCQPYSAAGKRLGKEDDRHLWPEMLRVIREVKPQWVVGENVRGLLNWNGGMVFHEVCADLENIGYEVQAFIIPASGVNAPHQRERLWITAKNTLCNGCLFREFKQERAKDGKFGNIGTRDTNGIYLSERFTTNTDKYGRQEQYRNMGEENEINEGKGNEFICNAIKHESKNGNVAHTDSNGFDKCNGNDEINASERGFNALNDIDQSNGIGNAPETYSSNNKTRTQREILGQQNRKKTNGYSDVECRKQWQNFPTQSPVCSGDDGISHGLDNITFSKWRNESIKGYGNAIVPQVVYRIFKTIEYIQNLNDNTQSKN
jgi:DNA (cytosine-5)-methyltransferase 1